MPYRYHTVSEVGRWGNRPGSRGKVTWIWIILMLSSIQVSNYRCWNSHFDQLESPRAHGKILVNGERYGLRVISETSLTLFLTNNLSFGNWLYLKISSNMSNESILWGDTVPTWVPFIAAVGVLWPGLIPNTNMRPGNDIMLVEIFYTF